MDKAIKSRWVAALRSGEFEQGNGGLVQNGKYCCLGVLRRVMNVYDTSGGGDQEWLTERQLGMANLTDGQQNKFIDFNDIKNHSFKWIAAYIERWL